MSNRGKRFEVEFKNSLNNGGYLCHRIRDNTFINNGYVLSNKTPADFLVLKAGFTLKILLIEAKVCSKKSIPFSRLQSHQKEALLKIDEYHSESHGFIAVNFYDKDNIRQYNIVYCIPIRVWIEYEEGERKSLSIKQCESDDRIIELKRCKNSMYYVDNLTNYLNSHERIIRR